MGSDSRISRRLLAWYARHRRDLPWRRTADPYAIWVSEIMLQQTRAQAVIPYYEKFLARFPDAAALARAREADVLALWSGLGYYSRARNLQRAAREIAALGRFPADYDGIRGLPGIGDYTAAAVASIAFDLPYAVLDGNVMRVLARLDDDASDIGAPATHRRFAGAAQEMLDRRHPGAFNQAMMELGATVCLPRAPECGRCPIAFACAGHRNGSAGQLPVKLRKTAPVRVDETVVVVTRGAKILLWRRGAESARMAGFWELPCPAQLPGLVKTGEHGVIRHSITHHRYRIAVETGEVSKIPQGFRWVARGKLRQIPLSTTAKKALQRLTIVG